MFAPLRCVRVRSSLALTVLFTACSSADAPVDANGDGIDDGVLTPNNVTVVTPSEPVGYVAGLVVSAATGAPVPNASVTLFGGGVDATTTTDEAGALSFGPIAAGAGFSLRVVADGYLEVTLAPLSIDDAAGNFPTRNGATFVGPIGLVPSGGHFALQLVSRAGAPVAGATVTFSASPRAIVGGVPSGEVIVTGTSDVEGLVRVAGLPGAALLPAATSCALQAVVAPVDVDADGATDLLGTTVVYDDARLRRGGRPPVIVLSPEERSALQVVASNVAGLVSGGPGLTSILGRAEDVRLVFNQPIARDSVLIDLRDETGAQSVAAPFVVGPLGNTLSFGPATALAPARQYGVAVHARTTASVATQVYDGVAYFYTQVDPSTPLALDVRLRDANADQRWGTGDDAVELALSAPVGRPGARTPFTVSLWLGLDLDGSGAVGDGAGELAAAGAVPPPPLVASAPNLVWLAGAAPTGFARIATALPFSLATPRTLAEGGVVFEAAVTDAEGRRVEDIAGRPVAARVSGTAFLQ